MYKIKKIKKHNKYIIAGVMGFICPSCLDGFLMKGKIVTKGNGYGILNMVCPECGQEFKCSNIDILDPNITDAIAILNKRGYTTKFCCEGHGSKNIETNDGSDDSYIYFEEKEDEKVLKTNPLPDSWQIERNDMFSDRFIVRGKVDVNKEKKMNDIRNWALNLPVKSELVKRFRYAYSV